MKLRLFWIFIAVIVVVCSISLPTFATSTHCHEHKGGREWRCAKDNYKFDHITVTNRIERRINFNVGKWDSQCGKNGSSYYDDRWSLDPNESAEIDFEEANANQCREIFIYNCREDWCTKILDVRPG